MPNNGYFEAVSAIRRSRGCAHHPPCGRAFRRSASIDKILNGHPDIKRNPAEQKRRNISTAMDWNRCGSAVGMHKALVGAFLANFLKAYSFEDGNYLSWLEDRNGQHSSDRNHLRADELANHIGPSVLKDQVNHFLEIFIEFLKSLALAVRAWKTRDIANIKPSVQTTLHNRSIVL